MLNQADAVELERRSSWQTHMALREAVEERCVALV